jgi:hypothetical protein
MGDPIDWDQDTLTQFSITEPMPGYWKVVFSNPPINLLNSTTVIRASSHHGHRQAISAYRRVSQRKLLKRSESCRAATIGVDGGWIVILPAPVSRQISVGLGLARSTPRAIRP